MFLSKKVSIYALFFIIEKVSIMLFVLIIVISLYINN